jgi:hypothetical protein
MFLLLGSMGFFVRRRSWVEALVESGFGEKKVGSGPVSVKYKMKVLNL